MQKKILNIKNNCPNYHIYTDGGSKQNEKLKHLPNESSIYSTEVTAIDLAMNIITNYKSSKFIIYSDFKSL